MNNKAKIELCENTLKIIKRHPGQIFFICNKLKIVFDHACNGYINDEFPEFYNFINERMLVFNSPCEIESFLAWDKRGLCRYYHKKNIEKNVYKLKIREFKKFINSLKEVDGSL